MDDIKKLHGPDPENVGKKFDGINRSERSSFPVLLAFLLSAAVIVVCLCGYTVLFLKFEALQKQSQNLSNGLTCKTTNVSCKIQSRNSAYWYQCSTDRVDLPASVSYNS